MNAASGPEVGEYVVYRGQINHAGEPLEEDPGGCACVCTNILTPVKLTLKPPSLPGKVRFSAETGGQRIKVWQNANRTGEVVLPKEWNSVTNVPSVLHVEGITNGAALRDITLTSHTTKTRPAKTTPSSSARIRCG